MESFGDFKALQDSISASLVAVTRSATHLSAEDLQFHRTLDSSVATRLDQQNARLLDLAERLLGNAASNTEVVGPRLPDHDSVDTNWRGIVDVVDSLLEKADTSLDEFTGAVKRLSPSREQTPTKSARPSRIAAALRNQDIPKPQLLFQHVPTNAEKEPFKPLLAVKPHSATSLQDTLQLLETEDGVQYYPHPYQTEIEQYEFPSYVYTRADPIHYLPYETTTATLVDTEEALAEMLEELKSAKEIAVDLEHHDQRSYIGIVSLMQISTRNKDWIVDTLKPWRRKLSCLNQVFANPQILKVLHGAYMDIVWLQRDLGLYLVGLFDTHHASKALGYTGGSLAFLLKKFIDFDAQKQYQTADWRIRPLPTELFDYARSDTHFLLYIYDNMRNELIERSDFSVPDHEKDKLHDVLVRSKEVALQNYQHPIYDFERGLGSGGWYKLLNRTPASLNKQQFAVFRAVHQWRDNVAREQDDSPHYVMANHTLFSISREMPSDKAVLLGVAQPLTLTMRLRGDEVLGVIGRAKETGKDGPEMVDVLKAIDIYLHGEPMAYAPAPAPALSNQAAIITAPANSNGMFLNRGTSGDALPIRSNSSSFWGSAFHSGASYQRRNMTSESLRLSVPLPPLTAEVFADPLEVATPVQQPTSKPTHNSRVVMEDEVEESRPEVFTLKQLGRKRKSDQMSRASDRPQHDGLAVNADEVGLHDDVEDDMASEKAARRAARKAEKRARKAAIARGEEYADGMAHDGQQQYGAEEGPGEEDAEAFDYASAPSVLHAAQAQAREERANRGKKGKDKGPQKNAQFNPYAKAMDTSKGVARGQKERAGRSMTFRK